VPDREHQKKKRKRYVDEKPAVEPVMQTDLEVEHPAFVAPVLNFFDSTAVRFGHAKFNEAKRVVGKARIIQPHPIPSMGAEIRKNLALDKFRQHSF
jgi:hypothetical protein